MLTHSVQEDSTIQSEDVLVLHVDKTPASNQEQQHFSLKASPTVLEKYVTKPFPVVGVPFEISDAASGECPGLTLANDDDEALFFTLVTVTSEEEITAARQILGQRLGGSHLLLQLRNAGEGKGTATKQERRDALAHAAIALRDFAVSKCGDELRKHCFFDKLALVDSDAASLVVQLANEGQDDDDESLGGCSNEEDGSLRLEQLPAMIALAHLDRQFAQSASASPRLVSCATRLLSQRRFPAVKTDGVADAAAECYKFCVVHLGNLLLAQQSASAGEQERKVPHLLPVCAQSKLQLLDACGVKEHRKICVVEQQGCTTVRPYDPLLSRRRVLRHLQPEPQPRFDATHYPNGVNHFFYTLTKQELSEKFGGEKGIFHDVESRDIARSKAEITSEMVKEVTTATNGEISMLELGCGTGLLTEAFAEAFASASPPFSSWHIFASEVSPGFVDLAQEHVEKLGISSHVDVFHHPPDSLSALHTSVADFAAVVDVYHHLEYPKTLISEMRRVLRPGGVLFLIDFVRDREVHKSHPDNADWIEKHVRGDEACFRDEILSRGFELEKRMEIDGLVENYCLKFTSTKTKF